MRIGVIGAGALGLFYGALLQRSGLDVHFLMRRDFQAVTRNGLKVFSPLGNFCISKVQAYRSSKEIGPVDVVLIGLKTYANDHLVSLTTPLVTPETTILTLQNGLGNEEILASSFDEKQIVGGVAFLCCNRGKPGTVYHLDQGAIRIAQFHSPFKKRAEQLANLFRQANITCDVSSDLKKIRWEKLVWNIPFNGLCALTGQPTDQLLGCLETKHLITELMAEVIHAANHQELTAPVQGSQFIEQLLQATEGMGSYQPSMMIDRQQGAPLELNAIYRIPMQRAAAKGVPMNRVAMLHTLLSAIDKNRHESKKAPF